MKGHVLILLAAVCALFGASPASAASGDIIRTYTLPNAQPDDYFGWTATSYGGSILATAAGGHVYVINPSSGVVKPLQRPSNINYVGFGDTVLVRGSRLYVTDPYVDIDGQPGEGAVFVYDSLEDNDPLIIPNPDDTSYNLFGTYIDANLAGDLIIGSPNFVNDNNNTVGRVYVYAPGATTPRLTLTGTLVNWLGQVAISDTGRFAITNNVEFVHLYNLHDASYYTTLQPTSPNMAGAGFGIDVIFIGDNVYTVDPTGGFRWEEYEWSSAVYRFDAATGALIRKVEYPYSPDNIWGRPFHLVDGIFAMGGPDYVGGRDNPAGEWDLIRFLDTNLDDITTAAVHVSAMAMHNFGSFGPYLLAAAPLYDDNRGAIHLIETPGSTNDKPAPDLASTELTVQADCKSKTSKKGTKTTCKLTGTITVSNQGLVESGKKKASITIYHSTDATLSPEDRRVGKAKIANIPAFGSAVATFKGKTRTATTGTYLIAVIDEQNKLIEGNEANNQLVYGPMP